MLAGHVVVAQVEFDDNLAGRWRWAGQESQFLSSWVAEDDVGRIVYAEYLGLGTSKPRATSHNEELGVVDLRAQHGWARTDILYGDSHPYLVLAVYSADESNR